MKMNEFTLEVHKNAVDHGWWDEEWTFGEIVAMCQSELSEALKEYRIGFPMVYGYDYYARRRYEEFKDVEDFGLEPEGVAVELTDCVIRILDWFGREELDVDTLMEEAERAVMLDVPDRIRSASFGDHIARWHLLLSLAYYCWCRASGNYAAAMRMALCVQEIKAWASTEGVDLERLLILKHDYNRSRPYRHGGKML